MAADRARVLPIRKAAKYLSVAWPGALTPYNGARVEEGGGAVADSAAPAAGFMRSSRPLQFASVRSLGDSRFARCGISIERGGSNTATGLATGVTTGLARWIGKDWKNTTAGRLARRPAALTDLLDEPRATSATPSRCPHPFPRRRRLPRCRTSRRRRWRAATRSVPRPG